LFEEWLRRCDRSTREAWLQLAKDFEPHFCSRIGQSEHVEQACERAGSALGARHRRAQRPFSKWPPSALPEIL